MGALRRLACLLSAGLLGMFLVGCQVPGSAMDVYSICVVSFQGEQQFEQTNYFADSLKSVEQLDSGLVQVIFNDDGGHIFYGEYERRWDPAKKVEYFSPDPNPDLSLIHSLSYDGATYPFKSAIVMPLPTEEVGNPKWHIRNANGTYALQVAVFYNTPTFSARKSAAAEYCKALRAKGEEAYYLHGTTRSIVVIGSFPENSMRIVQTKKRAKRPSLTGRRRQVVVESANVIINARLLELRRLYPANLHNGHKAYDVTVNPKTKRKEKKLQPSFVVEIPKLEEDNL